MYDDYDDRMYEFNAREDYLAELRAEHDDPWCDAVPEEWLDYEPTPEEIALLNEDIPF